jgi:hypothetical protein
MVRAVSQDMATGLGHHCATRALRWEVRQEPSVELAGEAMTEDRLHDPGVDMARSTIFPVELSE